MLHYLRMSTRMHTPVVRRPSLPITERDERDLVLLRGSEAHRAVLERMTGQPVTSGDVSESVLLHAVFEAGLIAVRSAIEDAAYAALAAEQAAEAPERRAQARRRRPTWADEA